MGGFCGGFGDGVDVYYIDLGDVVLWFEDWEVVGGEGSFGDGGGVFGGGGVEFVE